MLRFNANLFWTSLLLGCTFTVFTDGLSAQISLRMSAEPANVVGNTVTVGDVATVRCDSPSTAALIRKIDVEDFSQTQDEFSISKQQVLIRIQLAGYRLKVGDIEGPNAVMAKRLVSVDFKSNIELAIKQQVVSQFGITEEDLQVTVDPKYRSPATLGSFSAISISPWLRPDLPLGRQSVSISATVANQSKTFTVPVTVAVMRELAVASREISAGTKLTSDHVRSVRRPISSKASRYLTLEQTIGHVAKNNIEKYGLITPNLVRITNAGDDVIIKRNSMINVVVERNGIRVTLRDVKAVSDGKQGGRVQVENPNTGEKMSARVVGPFTAKIY
jgi:flagella basal body P-ring formation protein FlgA